MKKILDFVSTQWEFLFGLLVSGLAIWGLVWFVQVVNESDKRMTALREATQYDVYCVAQSGEVLFNERVADASATRGTVVIRRVDDSPEVINVIADCRITPVLVK